MQGDDVVAQDDSDDDYASESENTGDLPHTPCDSRRTTVDEEMKSDESTSEDESPPDIDVFDSDMFMDAMQKEALFGAVAPDDINLQPDPVVHEADVDDGEDFALQSNDDNDEDDDYGEDDVDDDDSDDEEVAFDVTDNQLRALTANGWETYTADRSGKSVRCRIRYAISRLILYLCECTHTAYRRGSRHLLWSVRPNQVSGRVRRISSRDILLLSNEVALDPCGRRDQPVPHSAHPSTCRSQARPTPRKAS